VGAAAVEAPGQGVRTSGRLIGAPAGLQRDSGAALPHLERPTARHLTAKLAECSAELLVLPLQATGPDHVSE
jgi:hypothetical protein